MEGKRSLFERLGGDAAIMAAVDRFYERVLADARTRPFFERLDMEKQVQKQMSFMAWAFGGPQEYRGRDLRTAHAPLVAQGLDDGHFDAVAEHLEATLRELGITTELIREVLATVETTRAAVLDRARG